VCDRDWSHVFLGDKGLRDFSRHVETSTAVCIDPKLHWAYTSVIGSVPYFADAKTKQLLESDVKFWRLVKENVLEHGPFPPMKVFKHGIQSLYSKRRVAWMIALQFALKCDRQQ
jgi:hypothetical protein